jgi:5-formaminoimidazole-4-carboxamide-1-(beta)-D-ribofuranosyl 5'-monophosphate synthetase
MNFNFFHTPISKQVDFIGIERRLQTNIHDYNALPAREQLEMDIDLQNIEVGHTPASIRESLLEKVLKMGDKFVSAVKKEYTPGIIGPFSLQSVITKDLELIVYDVSLQQLVHIQNINTVKLLVWVGGLQWKLNKHKKKTD